MNLTASIVVALIFWGTGAVSGWLIHSAYTSDPAQPKGGLTPDGPPPPDEQPTAPDPLTPVDGPPTRPGGR